MNDKRRTVSAGASAILPRGIPHSFSQRGVYARPFARGHHSWGIRRVFLGRGEMFATAQSRAVG